MRQTSTVPFFCRSMLSVHTHTHTHTRIGLLTPQSCVRSVVARLAKFKSAPDAAPVMTTVGIWMISWFYVNCGCGLFLSTKKHLHPTGICACMSGFVGPACQQCMLSVIFLFVVVHISPGSKSSDPRSLTEPKPKPKPQQVTQGRPIWCAHPKKIAAAKR